MSNYILTRNPDSLVITGALTPDASARVTYTALHTEASVQGDEVTVAAQMALALLYDYLASAHTVSSPATATYYQFKASLARSNAGLTVAGAGCQGYFATPRDLIERVSANELAAISGRSGLVTGDLLARYIGGDLILDQPSDVRREVIAAYARICTALEDVKAQNIIPALISAGMTEPYPQNDVLRGISCRITHLSLFCGIVGKDERVSIEADNAHALLARIAAGDSLWIDAQSPARRAEFTSKPAFYAVRRF